MRRGALVLVCLLVLLAGCSAFTGGDATTTGVGEGTETTTSTATDVGTVLGTTTETTAGADTPRAETTNATGATDTTPSGDDTAGASDETTNRSEQSPDESNTTGANSTVEELADPPSDRLGWEGGYWYNESIGVTPKDGFNASERAAVVNRTMARIETIRRLEFTESVPVSVVSREAYQRQSSSRGGEPSAALRAFDNAKFEALFMIGEGENSLSTQESNRNQSVAGFYSPSNDSIVVVSPTETPRLSRSTLSHELTHALQDQQFDISSSPPTRDGYNARNGAVEGEANYIQRRYEQRCNGGGNPDSTNQNMSASAGWRCFPTPQPSSSGGSASDIHFGVYLLQYFPYSDGPGFVDAIYRERGWEGVDQLHDALPESTEQVIYPDRYGNDTPRNLSIADSTENGWSRVRPESRIDYDTLGQSALSAMFGYTAYDRYNRSAVVSQNELLNAGPTGVNASDPINYGLPVTEGWDGDRLHVYRNDGETGYVWKLGWDSPEEAEEFLAGYEALLSHWGGERTGDHTWTVADDSPFTDAFSVRRDGDTVTIVNAPTTDALDTIH